MAFNENMFAETTWKKATVDAAKRSSISRLNNSIYSLQLEINWLSQELGKAYYERHKDDAVFSEDPERMTKIHKVYEEISGLQEQIEQIQGVKCPHCGAFTPAGSTFCSSCGVRLGPETTAPAEGRSCPQCHAAVGPDDLFCMSCGANLRKRASEGPNSEQL